MKNKNMTNVIGPIDGDTWYTMREIKESLKGYSIDPKYDAAKKKEKELFDHYMKKEVLFH